MIKKRFRKNLVPSHEVTKSFTGEKYQVPKKFSRSQFNIPKGLTIVGYLERLRCETPEKSNVNITNHIKSKNGDKPLVCSTGNGRLVLILSPDKISNKEPQEVDKDEIQEAIELHTAFHGVEPPDPIKSINVETDDIDHLIFCGWLNDIVYSAPKYSERKGLPYIHTARDKGDDEEPAKQKPYICISPAKDMIVMYGPEMSFTDRGIIG